MINFDFAYIIDVFPRIIKYIHVTMGIALLAMVIGLIIGTVIALIREFNIKGLNRVAKLYVSFFRGTPLLVQLFLLYYGLPQIFPSLSAMNAFVAAFIGLSLNSGAYISEVLRGAISSIDKGQMEAALSLGMTRTQGMKRIVLPQAIRVAIPALGNTFIGIIKESSLAFTLGVSEMLAQAKLAAAASYRFFESYLAVAIIYWVITMILTYLQGRLEDRFNKAY